MHGADITCRAPLNLDNRNTVGKILMELIVTSQNIANSFHGDHFVIFLPMNNKIYSYS